MEVTKVEESKEPKCIVCGQTNHLYKLDCPKGPIFACKLGLTSIRNEINDWEKRDNTKW